MKGSKTKQPGKNMEDETGQQEMFLCEIYNPIIQNKGFLKP